MDFRILGPLEIHDDHGAPVPLTAPMLRTALAALVLRAGRVTTVEALAGLLWGDAQPRSARATAQNYVKRLRRAIGDDRILTGSGGYRLRAEPEEIDLERFRALRARAREEAVRHPEAAAERIDRALALWRGGGLDDIGDGPLRADGLPVLEELRLSALQERFELYLRLGRHEVVLVELGEAARVHYTREVFTAQWMTALYREGRAAEAVEAYRTARRLLRAELGVEPGPRLRELEQAIRRGDAGPAGPAPRAAGARGGGHARAVRRPARRCPHLGAVSKG